MKDLKRFHPIWILALTMVSMPACAQPAIAYLPLERVSVLPFKLNETSGLARGGNGFIYTHNDSANKPALYRVSLATGEIDNTVKIGNAKNKDWEDLAEDDDYIYISDTGNNSGKRDDLRILKVNKKDLDKEEAEAEKIHFAYPKSFYQDKGKSHDNDCEALVAIGDSLYLFTKNRATHTTDAFRLPKEAGEYKAQHLANFNTNGLVTAADFLPGPTNALALLGYEIRDHRYISFLWIFRGFHGTDFFSGSAERYEVAPNLQAEAVIWETATTLLITNEEEIAGRGQVSRLTIPAAN